MEGIEAEATEALMTRPPLVPEAIDVEALAARVASTFPELTDRGRLVALETYRTLALGEPVPDYAIAAATGLQIIEVTEEMEGWPSIYRSESGRIMGFWGLALEDTGHSFKVDGRQLYTWCAWDTLFLPELLGQDATIESVSGVTGEVIVIEVGNGTLKADPATAVVSFVDPAQGQVDGERIISTFCHHILFFSARDEGEAWASAAGNGALILSIEEAFQIGRTFNELRFGAALHR